MLACLRLVAAAICLSATFVFAQEAAERGNRQVSPHHDIPSDGLGNFIRISGHVSPKSPDIPNGMFSIRFPRRAVRGVQITSGQVAISGAVIDQTAVQANRLIKSPVDYVTMNKAGNAVEFSTRTQDGVLKLPLILDKDAEVVVVIYLESGDGSAAFRYFLAPKGLSFEPVEKKAGKKRK